MKLFENYIEFESTRNLNILNRKAYDYKNKFDAFKIEIDQVESEEEAKFRFATIDTAFDFLGVSITKKDKNGTKLKDFITNRYELDDINIDWSALFVRCCLYNYVDRMEIDKEELKIKISKIIINPLKLQQGMLYKNKKDILPGDILVFDVELDNKRFVHYSIFLYDNDKGGSVVLDINVDKKGNIKKNGIHIIIKKGMYTDSTFLGYYNLYEIAEEDV